MSTVLEDGIDDELAAWLEAQPLFFVATAPTEGGHVNLSPKGYDTLRVLGTHRVAYRDLTGSGAETAAHLRDDGRISLMWTAFGEPPRIVRVQGRGLLHRPGDERYTALDAQLPAHPGARAIVEVEADRVSSSCGYAVPRMHLVEERPTLRRWAERRSPADLAAYRRRKNVRSVDGLPALEPAPDAGPEDPT